VIAEATRVLAGREWRGLEQAAILLARLDHKPAARRLVELLKAERPEVFVTAAWGLRKLAVVETLPDALRQVEATLKGLTDKNAPPDPHAAYREHLLSQLIQFLGQQKYAEADALL